LMVIFIEKKGYSSLSGFFILRATQTVPSNKINP
jgi:hypothetical protein